MDERDERLVAEEENLLEICNRLNDIKRSVDDILHLQNRELDYLIYSKYDLNNNRIDQFGKDIPVQSVDVYNTTDPDGVNRDQPYYVFGHGWGQGNTVNSDFTLTISSLNTNNYWAMTIHNFHTLNGSWVNQNGSNGLPGGAWGVHSSQWLGSDGCFIYQDNHLNLVQNKLSQWGLHQNHQISGTIR